MNPGLTRLTRFMGPLFVVACIAAPAPASAALQVRFDGGFDHAEREKLTTWISDVAGAVERLVGTLPIDVHIQFHRAQAREPVPWAHTTRGSRQGVRFYVDPSFSLAQLRADWTAPHELSHLILPYLGRRHAWFAEGFASFMQYRVMQEMGVITAAQATERYLERLRSAARRYPYPEQTIIEAAPRLRSERKHAVMYWGGASYFLGVDEALTTAHDDGVTAVMRRYVSCCRKNRASLNGLVEQLDMLTPGNIWADNLHRFRTRPGFPQLPPNLSDAD